MNLISGQADDASPNEEKKNSEDGENKATEAATNGTAAEEPADATAKPAETNGETNGEAAVAEAAKGECPPQLHIVFAK